MGLWGHKQPQGKARSGMPWMGVRPPRWLAGPPKAGTPAPAPALQCPACGAGVPGPGRPPHLLSQCPATDALTSAATGSVFLAERWYGGLWNSLPRTCLVATTQFFKNCAPLTATKVSQCRQTRGVRTARRARGREGTRAKGTVRRWTHSRSFPTTRHQKSSVSRILLMPRHQRLPITWKRAKDTDTP